MRSSRLVTVTPAKAGVQAPTATVSPPLDSRFERVKKSFRGVSHRLPGESRGPSFHRTDVSSSVSHVMAREIRGDGAMGPGFRGCNPIPAFGVTCLPAICSTLECIRKWGICPLDWAEHCTDGNGVADASGCGHAIAGIAIGAAAAMRRRSVLAQHRLRVSACRTQTARTFSRPCTRKRDMPRFLMMPCARSVSLRRR